MNIEVGQAIQYDKIRGLEVGYGVVVNVLDSYIEFVEVDVVNEFVKCYDDEGAIYPNDKDNVRLKDCPLPFLRLSGGQKGGVYALADMDNLCSLKKDDVIKLHVQVLDGGKCISECDMDEILHHPWPKQLEKQKTFRELPKVADQLDDDGMIIPKNNGKELGDD